MPHEDMSDQMVVRGLSRTPGPRLAGLLVVATLLTWLVVAGAAPADVLVNAIRPSTLKCGGRVRVGIWYQSFSGGPRWAHMVVRTRSGRLVWRKNATATTTWRFWNVRPLCNQHYVLTYETPGGTSRFPFYVK